MAFAGLAWVQPSIVVETGEYECSRVHIYK